MSLCPRATSRPPKYLLGADAFHCGIGDAVEVALVDVVVELTTDGEQAVVNRLATLAGRTSEQMASRYEAAGGLLQAGDRESRLSLLVAVCVTFHRTLTG